MSKDTDVVKAAERVNAAAAAVKVAEDADKALRSRLNAEIAESEKQIRTMGKELFAAQGAMWAAVKALSRVTPATQRAGAQVAYCIVIGGIIGMTCWFLGTSLWLLLAASAMNGVLCHRWAYRLWPPR